jgi:hypothetical protein
VRDLEAAFHGDHFAALVDFTATAT